MNVFSYYCSNNPNSTVNMSTNYKKPIIYVHPSKFVKNNNALQGDNEFKKIQENASKITRLNLKIEE